MKDCIVIGAGGHSRSLCSILVSSQEFNPLMVIDLKFQGQKEDILGLKVAGLKNGLSEDLKKLDVKNIFLAIGDNKKREELFVELKEIDFFFPNLIAGTSVIKQEVILGEGNVVFDNAYIGPLVKIENNNIINTASVIEHECVIGSHCNIGPCTVISGRCQIGNHTYFGSSSTVIDKITVASDVTLGAGSVVVRDLKLPGTYVGIPAQRIKNQFGMRSQK